MKDYQIILCEDYYENGVFKTRPVKEIGSSSSDFSGNSYENQFYTRIDGTHELSFKLSEYCFDESTGKLERNLNAQLVVNKSKILFIRDGKKFFFTVNEKEDIEDDGVFYHSYSCKDSFIEELSKTGYSLRFTEDLETDNGLGTIHELAEKIAKGTDWEYVKNKREDGSGTGVLYEYSTDLEFNIEQDRYDTVYNPIPVHPVNFIPELKRFCNETKLLKLGKGKIIGDVDGDGKLTLQDNLWINEYLAGKREFTDEQKNLADFNRDGQVSLDDSLAVLEAVTNPNYEFIYLPGTNYHPIYCFEDTNQICASDVKNLIYNSSEFLDTTGWTSFLPSVDKFNVHKQGAIIETMKIGEYYALKAYSKTPETNKSLLMNDTMSDTDQYFSAQEPYALRVVYGEGNKGKITQLSIFKENPLMLGTTASYTQNFPSGVENEKYYVVKTSVSVRNPYITFNIDCSAGPLIIKEISLFKVKGKGETEEESKENNLRLLSKLTKGAILTEEDKKIMSFPDSPEALKAYTQKVTKFFYLDDIIKKPDGEIEDKKQKERTIHYFRDFDEVFNNNNFYWNGKEIVPFKKEDYQIIPVAGNLFPPEDHPSGAEAKKNIYHFEKNNKYYQYYELTREGRTNGKWDLALYDAGENDKRRTLIAEKSNRFNLIQDLSELFKVWPVFHISQNPDTGEFIKEFYFKENCIKQNFAGFHKGVNLIDIQRVSQSDEIVTKMFVEDQENKIAKNGFITIRTSPFNPWGENYYYNFQYYIKQKLINSYKDGIPIIEKDKDDLYRLVKGYNTSIFDYNEKIVPATVELNNLNAQIKSVSVSIAAMLERITSIQADLDKFGNEMGDPDIHKLQSQQATYGDLQKEYEKKKAELQKQYDALKADYDGWKSEVEAIQEKKEKIIKEFENKYSQYIKEGVWSDNSYTDDDTYYLDSQKVSNTSAIPKTEWRISVLDGSAAKELENYHFEVGDQTLLVDNDFFGEDLQNREENFTFEVLITGIKENLDDSTQNEIEVRNYLTSFEDMFQRISAATQTLELNEQTYNKAAYFTANKQVDKSILQNTLLNNEMVLANSMGNSYTLDTSGLALQSLVNPKKKVRLIAEGLFLSNSTGLNGEEEWKTGITADGINADILTAGTINTSVIKIFSNGQPNFSWNQLGITAYKTESTENGIAVDSNSFIRLDNFGLYLIEGKKNFNIDGEGNPWFNGKTREQALNDIVKDSIFSVTERGLRLNVRQKGGSGELSLKYDEKDPLIYGLYIKDAFGKEVVRLQSNGDNEIAGWKIKPGRLESTTGKYDLLLSSGGDSKYTIKAGSNFSVDYSGKLTCKNADIQGRIIASSGIIGGWEITNVEIKSSSGGRITSLQAMNSGIWSIAVGATNAAAYSSAPFRVDHNGVLYATSAHIAGEINASSGTIGGWTIGSSLYKNKNGWGHSALSKITTEYAQFEDIGSLGLGNYRKVSAKISSTDANGAYYPSIIFTSQSFGASGSQTDTYSVSANFGGVYIKHQQSGKWAYVFKK